MRWIGSARTRLGKIWWRDWELAVSEKIDKIRRRLAGRDGVKSLESQHWPLQGSTYSAEPSSSSE
jgi:hypothetical protein